MVGLEAVVPAVHDVVEEVDDRAAVARLGADELDHQVFVHRREHREEVLREQGEEVIPKWARGVLWLGRRALVLAGAEAAFPPFAVVAGLVAVLGYEVGGLLRPVLHELLCGVDPVAELRICDVTLHEVEEEVYDARAVVGLFANDLGDGGRLPLLGCLWDGHICFVHECYYA